MTVLSTQVEDTPLEFKIVASKADVKTVSKIRAKKFVDLVTSGVPAKEAAKQCHTTLNKLEEDVDVKKIVDGLLKDFDWDAERRKRVTRAKMNQILVTGQDKDSINAAKVIANDPEVGIAGQVPLVAQQFNFSEGTLALLNDLDDSQ